MSYETLFFFLNKTLAFAFIKKSVLLQHETASLAMFDYLVDDNGLKQVMEEHGLVLPEDLDFIKEQIAGPLLTSASRSEVTGYG